MNTHDDRPVQRGVRESAAPPVADGWYSTGLDPGPASPVTAGGYATDPPSPASRLDAADARAEIYDVECAKAARWARTLIFGSAAAWVAAVGTAVVNSQPVVMTFDLPPPISYLADPFLFAAFLVATLVVFYLVVNQRELIQKRAHASGAAAVRRFDRREEVLGAAGSAQGFAPHTAGTP